MRWFAPFAIVLLAGCFGYDHGCWEDSRSPTWIEPGIYERLLEDPAWDHRPAEGNLPEGSRFEGDWVWLVRHLDAEQSVRLGERDGHAKVLGLLRSNTPDAQAATAIEAFVLDHTGLTVDGQSFLEPRRNGDPHRLIGGDVPASVDVAAFLARDGAWQSSQVGLWDYIVGDDTLVVRVSTLRFNGDWGAGVVVDAGDRVMGPSVEANADEPTMKAAATAWWQGKGLGEPTFQDFGYEVQEICT